MNRATTIDRGLQFLCGAQEAPGCWSDWRLPPGESRMWTTAYVGSRLAELRGLGGPAVAAALSAATAWLQAGELPGGGWGYSDLAGPDADSTALGILCLRRCGQPASRSAQSRLATHQQTDGGFATFTTTASHGSWTDSHVDVSATALLAMLATPGGRGAGAARAFHYLQGQRRADGLWHAFWWTSDLYATAAALAGVTAMGADVDPPRVRDALTAVIADTAFEHALLLRCLVSIGAATDPRAVACIRALAETQTPDGSWPGDAELRLVPRHVRTPWSADDTGPRFRDERRVFTTATVVNALGIAERARTQRANMST